MIVKLLRAIARATRPRPRPASLSNALPTTIGQRLEAARSADVMAIELFRLRGLR
jgi:hypothetical protein